MADDSTSSADQRSRQPVDPRPSHTADANDTAATSTAPLSLITALSAPLAIYSPVPLPFCVRWCVAPMVGASDLCFRMLTRRHGATLCYTPMLHADRMGDDAYFRSAVDFAHPTRNAPGGEDRPLIAQFAANDSALLLSAALRIQPFVDAVDLNLGCPQASAFEGRFGSFLLSRRQWPLVARMVRTLRAQLTVPVTAKIRLLASHAETHALCTLLIESGCSAIAIHGRQRGSDKRRRVGPADLQAIARLRAELPRDCTIIANGNVRSLADARANLETTRCEGIMSAEAVLANPRLFDEADAADAAAAAAHSAVSSAAVAAAASIPSSSAPPPPRCIALSLEYLSLCGEYPAPPGAWMSDHVHNMCREPIAQNQWADLKAQLKAIGRERTAALHSSSSSLDYESSDVHGACESTTLLSGAESASSAVDPSASACSSSSSSDASLSSRCVDLPGTLERLRAVLRELERRLADVARTGNPHAQLQQERQRKREGTAQREDEAPVDLDALGE